MSFALAPDAGLRRTTIGVERAPLIVIDRVLADPAALVDAAAGEAFAPAYGPAGGYPGIRAPAPLDYVERVVRAIDPVLRETFGLGEVRLGRAECNFSIVTLPGKALVASQRVPHVDTVDPLQFAILHYLCDAGQGGTGFYRHRATGYATLTADRIERYDRLRAGEVDPPGYIDGDTPAFERIAEVAARFDRLIAYRSNMLHSGIVTGDIDPDPRRGRLTANIFLSYRAG